MPKQTSLQTKAARRVVLQRLVRSLACQAGWARKHKGKYDPEVSPKAHYYHAGLAEAFQWAHDALKTANDSSSASRPTKRHE